MKYTDNLQLLELAENAMKNTYSPYSCFPVGAAAVAENGEVYTGCNIENASFGATNCAERTAIFKAISEGNKKIDRIAVVSSEREKIAPCGICLQVMNEFMGADGIIVLKDSNGIYEYKLSDFLPYAFDLEEK